MPETVTVAVSTFGRFLMGAVAAGLRAASRNGRRSIWGETAGSIVSAVVGEADDAGRAAVADDAGRSATTDTPVTSVTRMVTAAGSACCPRRRAPATCARPAGMRALALTG